MGRVDTPRDHDQPLTPHTAWIQREGSDSRTPEWAAGSSDVLLRDSNNNHDATRRGRWPWCNCFTNKHANKMEPVPSSASDLEENPLRRVAARHQKTANRLVIDPVHSTWLPLWDIVDGISLVFVALFWPYQISFLEDQHSFWIRFPNLLVDGVMVIDMSLQFFIAYPDREYPDRLVKVHRNIVHNYLTGAFWADLIALMPVEHLYILIVNLRGGKMEADWLKFLRLARLTRLIRLTRFQRLTQRWHTQVGFHYARMTLAKLLIALLICCHWMACIWGGLAFYERADGGFSGSWVIKLCGDDADEVYRRHWDVYSLALYWAVITLTSIGYGDITPSTMLEYRVATACSCIMASMWAYVIGAICSIVATLDQYEATFKNNMDNLNWFMSDRNMPQEMRTRLRKYFFEAKVISKQRVEREVLDQMSPLLQGECAMFIHENWIKQVWYLREMPKDLIVWAARSLHVKVYAPNEEVIGERTLWIVQRGLCAYRGRILATPEHWGDDMLLSNPRLRRSCKSRALSHLLVLSLQVEALVEISMLFPEAMNKLRWAQIQLAVRRGIMLIAMKLRELEAAGVNPHSMSSSDRLKLMKRVLQEEDFCVAEVFGCKKGRTTITALKSPLTRMDSRSSLQSGAFARQVSAGTSSNGGPGFPTQSFPIPGSLDRGLAPEHMTEMLESIREIRYHLLADAERTNFERVVSESSMQARQAESRARLWPQTELSPLMQLPDKAKRTFWMRKSQSNHSGRGQ